MAISYANTDELEEISKEIVSLSNELNREINNLYNRLNDVPDITKEWTGNKSSFYFNRIMNDKKQYLVFIDSLRDIGYKINQDVFEIKSCINKNNEQES